MASPPLSPNALMVRRYDRDRFVTALFAPLPVRDDLLTLFAFNMEIARIAETVREPLLGEIRLQWWRDTLDQLWRGIATGHPVADGLADVVVRHHLPRQPLDRLVEARAFDQQAAPMASVEALQRYVADSSAGLTALAALLLVGPSDAAQRAAREVGQAWGLIGVLRAHAFLIKRRRLVLPLDLLAAQGLDPEEILAGSAPPGLDTVTAHLADRAASHLRAARLLRRDLPPGLLPALLPARLADGYLSALHRVRYNLLDRRWSRTNSRPLALLLSTLLGRY